MGAFGKSFEETFKVGLAKGADAVSDIMKEKIKKNAEKVALETARVNQQTSLATLINQANEKDPELASDLAGLEIDKLDTNTLKTLNTTLGKRLIPDSEFDQFIKQGGVSKAILDNAAAGRSHLNPPGIGGPQPIGQPQKTTGDQIAGIGATPTVSGFFGPATIPPTPQVQTQQPAAQPTAKPARVNVGKFRPGDIKPTKINSLGIPEGFEIVKPSEADEKDVRETAALAQGIANLVKDFSAGQSQVKQFQKDGGILRTPLTDPLEAVTIGKFPKGAQDIIAGKSASMAAIFGTDGLDKVRAYDLRRKAFSTRVAKAAGEQRPTDVDIERFLATLPSFDLADDVNANLVQGLIDDVNARRLSDSEIKMLSIFFGQDPTGIDFDDRSSASSLPPLDLSKVSKELARPTPEQARRILEKRRKK